MDQFTSNPVPPNVRYVQVPRTPVWPILLVILFCAAAFWLTPVFVERIQIAKTAGEQKALRESSADMSLVSLNQGSARLAKLVLPSVVHIDTQKVERRQTLFGMSSQRFQSMAEASGVIVDSAGYIVTNSHVVAGADHIRVKIMDHVEAVDADVVGVDEEVDLAVLKIKADGLIAAEWGDSKELQVGQFVWAVGNPFGLDGSVSLGIISAIGRHFADTDEGGAETRAHDFLQTDAAINPGNSGGPLVNIEGKVIGINTAIVGPTNQGIGFAIPSDMAKATYERLRESKAQPTKSKHPGYLGLSLQPVTSEIAQFLSLPDTRGALVAAVQSGSPAEKAGLKPRDVIVGWNDERIDNPLALVTQAAKAKIDSKVTLTIIRDGQKQQADVVIEPRPAP